MIYTFILYTLIYFEHRNLLECKALEDILYLQ